MIGDRDYMKAGDYRPPLTLTAILTIVMVVVFAVLSIDRTYLHPFPQRWPAQEWLALTRDGLRKGWVWQLITFQFLHGGIWHLLINLMLFWWLGRFCENLMGRSRFIIALLGCGVAGGLFQAALMIAFSTPTHSPFGNATVGASAGISGLLAIFALLSRDQELHLYMVIPIRAIVLLYAMIAMSLFFTLVPPGDGVAHAAHLGGLLAGVAWIKLGWHHDYIHPPWERWLAAWRERRSRRPVRLPRSGPVVASVVGRSAAARKETGAAAVRPLGPTEFISREVDPILDKIAAHGIHSLTDEEKRVLENARSRIGR